MNMQHNQTQKISQAMQDCTDQNLAYLGDFKSLYNGLNIPSRVFLRIITGHRELNINTLQNLQHYFTQARLLVEEIRRKTPLYLNRPKIRQTKQTHISWS